MPNTLHARIGPRDLELLTAIDRFPVTSAQLCRISLSFKEPFRDENNLRRRLRSLTLAGFIRSFPYAVASEGRSPRYFKLTREGYRFLYGSQAAMPKRRYFQEIRPGHHHHTLSIAEPMIQLTAFLKRHRCFRMDRTVTLQERQLFGGSTLLATFLWSGKGQKDLGKDEYRRDVRLWIPKHLAMSSTPVCFP